MTPAIPRAIAAAVILLAVSPAASPQGLLSPMGQASPSPQGSAQPSPAQPASATGDALGRATPAGTVMGFLSSSASGDWVKAARYLDTRLPPTRAEELARELKVLLDRGLSVDLNRLSRKPEGEQDVRYGRDHELVGTIETESGKLDVVLVRVHYGDQPPVWLFSPETLREVPSVHEEYEPSVVERLLPDSVTRGYGASYRWWTWLVLVALTLIAVLVSVVVTRALRLLARIALRRVTRGRASGRWTALFRPARWLVFGLVLAAVSGSFLTLRQRYLGGRAATFLVIGSMTWMGVAVLATLVGKWARTLEQQGTSERVALVRLTGRLLQFLAVVVGVLVFLRTVGINLTPVLAGLGVGGIAVALASQKTLENLFGGMIVIGDSPIRIGNFCRVGTILGTVEDIGLRSTRIRTLARTIVSIPNADLASQSIENFATRDKLLFNHSVTLRYETTPDQLRHVITQARTLLYEHAAIEPASARVRLLRLAPSGLEVELFAYVAVTDYDEYLAIQEDILLRLMDAVAASGTALAFPSQALYLSRDGGIDREKAAAAVEAVRAWRERGELPFPDLAPAEKANLLGRIEYPPRESVSRKGDRRS